MDRLVTLFKESSKDESWVRIPIVQYLHVCPLPAAAGHLEELGRIDPRSVERASQLAPLKLELKPEPPAEGNAQ
jgi:hypothetical protein